MQKLVHSTHQKINPMNNKLNTNFQKNDKCQNYNMVILRFVKSILNHFLSVWTKNIKQVQTHSQNLSEIKTEYNLEIHHSIAVYEPNNL